MRVFGLNWLTTRHPKMWNFGNFPLGLGILRAAPYLSWNLGNPYGHGVYISRSPN